MASLVRKHEVRIFQGTPYIPPQPEEYEYQFVPLIGSVRMGPRGPIGADFPYLEPSGRAERATFFVPIVKPIALIPSPVPLGSSSSEGGSLGKSDVLLSFGGFWRISARYEMIAGVYTPTILLYNSATYKWEQVS